MSNEKKTLDFDEEFGDLLAGSTPVKDVPKVDPVNISVTPVVPREVVSSKEDDPVVSIPSPSSADKDGYVSFGTRIESVPIPRFKASKDTKARFAILSKKVLTKKIHYVPGIGSFECMEGKCCELEGLPKVRYLIPVIQYTVNKAGVIVGNDIELKALALGGESYSALVDAIEFSGRDVSDIDIIATCSDEQYQKLTFAADASKGAAWKSFPTAKTLVDKYRENRDKLYMAVCRRISMETYLMKKGFVNPSGPVPPDQYADITDVIDS